MMLVRVISKRDDQHRPAPLEDEIDHRVIDADHEAVDRILLFVRDLAADEPAHQHRHEGDRQQRRRAHGVGLGVGQRLEHPPRLLAEGEDREEGDGDDQQRVEERRADFLGRSRDDLPVRLLAPVALQVLVGILDHDDRRIDHRADGDGDAAQAHDVGVDPLEVHDDEGDQDRHRQGQDRHQGTGKVEQEQGGDQGDDDALLDQLLLEGIDRPFDQAGAVVDRLDVHPFGEPLLQLLELLLDRSRWSSGHFRRAHDDDAADRFPLAVQFGQAAPQLGADGDPGQIPQQDRRPRLVGADHHLLDILAST